MTSFWFNSTLFVSSWALEWQIYLYNNKPAFYIVIVNKKKHKNAKKIQQNKKNHLNTYGTDPFLKSSGFAHCHY